MLRFSLATVPVIAASLASCISSNHVMTDAAGLPSPSTLQIRRRIVEWSADFLADPASTRFAALSHPIPFRTRSGAKTWLVCIEYDVREPGGPYVGLQRLAFGFGSEPPVPTPASPGSPAVPWTRELARQAGKAAFYPPLGRHGNEISNRVCDEPSLGWVPFPALERLHTPLSRAVVIGQGR